MKPNIRSRRLYLQIYISKGVAIFVALSEEMKGDEPALLCFVCPIIQRNVCTFSFNTTVGKMARPTFFGNIFSDGHDFAWGNKPWGFLKAIQVDGRALHYASSRWQKRRETSR